MKSALNVLLVILLTTIASCTKDSNNKPVYIDQEFKQQFNYKVGSYWVYYDSINQQIDSFVVSNTVDMLPFQNSGHEQNHLEDVYMAVKAYNSDTIISFFDYIIEAPNSFKILVYGYNYYDQTLTILSGRPIVTGEVGYSCYVTYLPEFVDNGIIYKDVYRYSTVNSKYTLNIYISASAGIICLKSTGDLINEKSLHLIRSHFQR